MRRLWIYAVLALLALGTFSGCDMLCELCDESGGTSPGPAPDVEVEVPRGGSVTREVTVRLPDPGSGELGADVMWLVDLSGSFDDDLANWRTQTRDIAGALQRVVPNLRVGLASFVDAPCGEFGFEGDYGYKLELALTDDVGALGERVDDLEIYNGWDEPESQLEAMYQAMTGAGRRVTVSGCESASIPSSSPGWTSGRLRFLLVSTDAAFHTPADAGYPYPTTAADVIDTAKRLGVRIFFFNSGELDRSASDIAAATGGAVYDVGADSSELVNAIDEAVNGAVSRAEVRLVPVGDRGLVSRVSPASRVVDLRTTRSVTFQVTFTDTGSASGEVRFNLEVRVNGSQVHTLAVVVRIR